MSERARLSSYVTGARDSSVDSAAEEWRRCQLILINIGQKIAGAGPGVQTSIGGETGPAVADSFNRAANTMGGQAEEFALGAGALTQAAETIRKTERVDEDIKANPLTPPTVPTRSPGPMTAADLSAQRQFNADQAGYQRASASQEDAARTAADDMDESYREVIAVMKQIHGVPDPPPPAGAGDAGTGIAGAGAPGGAGGSGTGPGGGTPPNAVGPGTASSGGGNPGDGAGVGSGPAGPGGAPIGAVGPPGVGGGVEQGGGTAAGPPVIGGPLAQPTGGSSGGAAGGLGGVGAGALIAGGVTGLTSGIGGTVATPFSGAGAGGGGGRGPTRAIGGTGRPGGPGTLGRGTGVLPATGANGTGRGTRGGVRGVGGAGTNGRGAGRAGGRGVAGTGVRGAGAGAGGGRGSGTKDRRRGADRDLFDDGQDWIDDEDLAPDVLD